MADEIRRSPAEAARIAARLELLRQIDTLTAYGEEMRDAVERIAAERDALRAAGELMFDELSQWQSHTSDSMAAWRDNSPSPVEGGQA